MQTLITFLTILIIHQCITPFKHKYVWNIVYDIYRKYIQKILINKKFSEDIIKLSFWLNANK